MSDDTRDRLSNPAPGKQAKPTKPKRKYKKRRYKESRAYRGEAQDLVGISPEDIQRVASLPDLDLFKRPGRAGRPSKYTPEMCERAIQLGENGNSLTQIAVKLGIDTVTMLNWSSENPEFSRALKVAQDAAKAWWEDMGMIGMVSEKFNSGVWSKSMSARFRDEYVESRRTEISGEVVEKREITLNARQIDPEAREALKAALLSIKRAVDGDGE